MKTFFSALLALTFMSASTLYAQQQGALGVRMSDNSVGGVLITGIVANSPAARIGLQSGDRILAINNQPTANYRDVIRIIGASAANAPVTLKVARGPWQGTLSVAVGSASAVFNPAQQFVPASPAQQYMPASTPVYSTLPRGFGGFPREWVDNGSRGAAAAYGGGGW